MDTTDRKKSYLWLLIIILIAFISGGTGYLMARYQLQTQIENLNNQLNSLQSQMTQLNKNSNTLNNSTSSETDETADWKTYTSSSNGYSIKYPKTWVYDSPLIETIAFRQSESGQWVFSIEATTTNKTLIQNVDIVKASKEKDGYAVTQSNITVGGVSAVQLKLTSNEAVYGDTINLIVNKGKLYTIAVGIGANQNESKMLESFQFTN